MIPRKRWHLLENYYASSNKENEKNQGTKAKIIYPSSASSRAPLFPRPLQLTRWFDPKQHGRCLAFVHECKTKGKTKYAKRCFRKLQSYVLTERTKACQALESVCFLLELESLDVHNKINLN